MDYYVSSVRCRFGAFRCLCVVFGNICQIFRYLFLYQEEKFAKINFYKSNACTCLLFCVILCEFYILHTNKVVISKINCPP